MYKSNKKGWLKHLDFIVIDVICLQIAYCIAFMVRHGWYLPYSVEIYLDMTFIMIFVQICTMFFLDNYKDIIRRGYYEEFKAIFVQISVTVMISFSCMFFMKSSREYSRAVFLRMWVISIVVMYAAHLLRKTYVRKRLSDTNNLRTIILVTESELVEDTVRTIRQSTYKDYYFAGIILLDQDKNHVSEWEGIACVADKENALTYLKNHHVDEVFIHSECVGLTESILAGCEEMGITIHQVLAKMGGAESTRIVEQFAGYAVVTSTLKMATPRQLFLKRALDIVGGIVGIVFTAILTIVLGPIIYIQSPGPIFFSQKRVGKNGKIFNIYKFRSMYPDAEERKKELMKHNKMQGLMFKMDDDPRIIPIGHFIRKTSLDEFPQFLNVLRGDMSLVGTRPPTVDEYEQYEMHHKARLAVKPGLTGMWQISGRSDIVDFEEVVALDAKYIREWSIGLDLKILCQTILVVLKGRGSV
ncbi:MAG: sugar transferase [Hespellia sp.]|nr:sugar transferase [Hespellia sp.]